MKLPVDIYTMLNFIQVSFCYLLFLGLRLGLGLCLGTDNLQNILKIFDRWRCKHVRHSLSTDACVFLCSPPFVSCRCCFCCYITTKNSTDKRQIPVKMIDSKTGLRSDLVLKKLLMATLRLTHSRHLLSSHCTTVLLAALHLY